MGEKRMPSHPFKELIRQDNRKRSVIDKGKPSYPHRSFLLSTTDTLSFAFRIIYIHREVPHLRSSGLDETRAVSFLQLA